MGVTLGKMLSLLFLYATLMKRIVLHTHAHTTGSRGITGEREGISGSGKGTK